MLLNLLKILFISVKTIMAPTMDIILREWADLSERQIHNQLAAAKAKPSNKRSAREAFITDAKAELVAARRRLLPPVLPIRYSASDGDHINLALIVPPPSQLMLHSYNPLTGALVSASIKQWVEHGLYNEKCLVIHGHARCAKTRLASALCALLARTLQKDSGTAPFYLKVVGSVDGLRIAKKDGQLRAGVPILFDDVTPSAGRGSRVSMSIDDVKRMTESADSTSLQGRNSDIVLARGMPKIFTSTAECPHAWLHDLPVDIFTMSDAQRLSLHASVASVFKRCYFLHLTSSVVPSDV